MKSNSIQCKLKTENRFNYSHITLKRLEPLVVDYEFSEGWKSFESKVKTASTAVNWILNGKNRNENILQCSKAAVNSVWILHNIPRMTEKSR